jgi:putative permease
VGKLGRELPDYVERYRGLREEYESLREEYPGLPRFDEQARTLGGNVTARIAGQITALPTTLFGAFLDVLSVFAISMLLITSRGRLLEFILSLTHPDHREATEHVLKQMWRRVGYYLRAKIIVMGIIAAITYVALRLLGVPYALLLAIVVGLGEAIPRVGPWLARIPLLGIAALEGWRTLGLTFLASVIIENAKGYAISPFVEGDQLDIHPLLVFVSVLIGGALLGFAGAFIAVPAAALIQVVFEEVIIPWRRARIGEPAPSSAPRTESPLTSVQRDRA